ncbi:MAG: hypothetical protein AABZ39_21195 [Spirochaetota bacterium]
MFVRISIVIFTAALSVNAIDTSVRSQAVSQADTAAFCDRLSKALTKHGDTIIGSGVSSLKGKSADGMMASVFHLMFETTGNTNYRAAAVTIAERIIAEMKATKFGVIYIKEKEKGGESISGGGPPAFGFYTAEAARIFFLEKRYDEVQYIAAVLDAFPWSEEGWWAATVDIATGKPKEPMSKPSPINKNAAIAMAVGMISEYCKGVNAPLSARLKSKADRCLKKIIAAQEADGFWHYSLSGNDPNNKDILGYFMLTTEVLMRLREYAPSFRGLTLTDALGRAGAFAFASIAPMTDPNTNKACSRWSTRETPAHYSVSADGEKLKRTFQLGCVLIAGGYHAEGMKIIDHALKYFPYGDAGMDGAHAAYPGAFILSILRH